MISFVYWPGLNWMTDHQNKNAADVDNFKNKVFETVKMPLFRVNTSPESYESQLDGIMKNIININRSNANHTAKR